MRRFPGLEFSISATSRPPRGAESDGVDYHFVTAEEFRHAIDEGKFVEWEEVYEGNYYGTLRSEVEGIWERGNVCIFDVDVIGGIRLKSIFGDNALSFFIMAPSPEELRRRLIARGTDSEESIERRIAKAEFETAKAREFDHIIVNDDIDRAVGEITDIITPFING
jgi:guanylate kinase